MGTRHSKKHIKSFYDKIRELEDGEVFSYIYKYYSDYEPFATMFLITRKTFTVVSYDWTQRGSETYYFNNFNKFKDIFTLYKGNWWRIPFGMIKE